MRVAVVFDTPYPEWDHLEHERQMDSEVAGWKTNEPEMEYQIANALRERGHDIRLLGVRDDLAPKPSAAWSRWSTCCRGCSRPVKSEPDLVFPLIVKPLQADASAGISQASVMQDVDALEERVALEVLPITEMVFDKRRTQPEERIATQFAKWDESYRERRGIRNVMARPIAKTVRDRIMETCRTAYRALWLRDYARLDLRLTADGQVWVLEANANPFISYGHDMANAAAKAGMEYADFIQRIVDAAIARYERA